MLTEKKALRSSFGNRAKKLYCTYMKRGTQGFSLIELLVVISIVSLLASIVMSSLASARLKAKDAAIREAMWQMRNVYEASFAEKGDYAGWHSKHILSGGCNNYFDASPDFAYLCSSSSDGCDAIFLSKIVTPNSEAAQICKNIVAIGGNSGFIMGIPFNTPGGNKNHYSIAAWLPFKKTYLCIGSEGKSSDTSGYFQNGTFFGYDTNNPPGCFNNP